MWYILSRSCSFFRGVISGISLSGAAAAAELDLVLI